MADLIIKPATGDGNKLILQDKAGGAVLTTADSGATIASATLTSPTINTPTITGAATFSGDLVPSTPLSNRNMIINGGMQVWQRATAATAVAGYCTVDRFHLSESGDGDYTSQKHDMSLAELNTTGHRTALQLNCTTADASVAAGHYGFFRYRIEGQDLQQLQYGTASAKTITLSFWVKSNKTGIYCVDIEKKDSTTYFIPIEYTISSADTWEQKVITITPTAGSTSLITGAGGVIDNNNDTGLEIGFGLKWGSDFHGTNNTWTTSGHYSTSNQVNWMDSTSNNFYLTGVQLELGSNATPFEHRSYGDELARCQRYYEYRPDTYQNQVHGSASGRGSLTMDWAVEKRADPTVTFKDGAGTVGKVTYHSNNLGNGGNNNLGLYYWSQFHTHCLFVTDSYSGYDFYINRIAADAEL